MILSLATTNLIIERCICDYLQSIIISGESLGCPSKPTRESPAIFSQSASVRKAHHAEDFADLASQPCEYGSSPRAPTTQEPEARHGVRAEQPIFAALENYIISCFEDIETLNLSFSPDVLLPPHRLVAKVWPAPLPSLRKPQLAYTLAQSKFFLTLTRRRSWQATLQKMDCGGQGLKGKMMIDHGPP